MKIIFSDLDGTLEDSRLDMAEAVNRVRKAFKLSQREYEALANNVNRGMDELYRTCFDDYISSCGLSERDAIEKVRVAYEADYMANVARHTKLYEEVFETIPKLAAIAKLVCVTNKPEKITDRLLQELGIRKYFDVIMGGDSCSENKPSPLPLKLAAEKLGYFDALEKEAYMMGDTLADVKAGKAFGAKTIWCAWGYLPAPPEVAPDFIARRPSELLYFCSGKALKSENL